MGRILVLALLSAVNPTLVASATVMMLLSNPIRLMASYLAGALLTSVTLGLVIVFSFEFSGAVKTDQHTLSPAATIALGGLLLVVSFVLGTGRHERLIERRRARSRDKGPPRWQRALGKGSARVAFVVGAVLTLPGAIYLAGLYRIDHLNYSTVATVGLVVAFNAVMLVLLEVPLAVFAVAPERTLMAMDRTKAWMGLHGRQLLVTILGGVGVLLVIKGVIELN
ncbi:MAG TPA: GAP family protein [Solirubrobacteraceae bacterium]|nr:GAP family protein [Solirubrobacteraceae bacterium]